MDDGTDLHSQLRKHAEEEHQWRITSSQAVAESRGASVILLAGLVAHSRNLGRNFVEAEYGPAKSENDPVFYVLMHLHANAMLAASEVVALLESGYAGGAFARWRTLFESMVYASFIGKHGAAVAERYVKHAHIKDAEDHSPVDRTLKNLGALSFSDDDNRMIEELKEKLLHKFGNEFKEPLGWAKASLSKKNRLTINDLCRDLGLADYEMFQSLSSHHIHPTWK